MSAAAYWQHQRIDQQALVEQHAELVRKIALYLKARLPENVELEDLLQVGAVALLEAARNFQPGQGATFETYAGIRIRGAMLDEVRRNDWTPRRVRKHMRDAARVMHEIEQTEGRAATEAEIADRLGIGVDEYGHLLAEAASSNVLTLSPPGQEDGGDIEVEQTGVDPAGQVEEQEVRMAIADAIGKLPEREQLILSLYYEEELNQTEIGEVIGVSYSRVSQLLGQTLLRLRGHVASLTEPQPTLSTTRRSREALA